MLRPRLSTAAREEKAGSVNMPVFCFGWRERRGRGRECFERKKKKQRQLLGGVDVFFFLFQCFHRSPIPFLPLLHQTKIQINSPANLSSTSTVLDARGKREKRGSDEMWAKRGSAATVSCKAEAAAAAALPLSATCGRRWPAPALPLLGLSSVVIADARVTALWRGADASRSRERAARRRDRERERD